MAANDRSVRLKEARESGKLLDSTLKHLEEWLGGGFLPEWAETSIQHLVDAGEWEELNDRFFRNLEFGTGGMRGRTMGKVISPPEMGKGENGIPENPGVGSNLLNDFNVARATLGLYRAVSQKMGAEGRAEPPALVIAHDVRYFSRHFAEIASSVWQQEGGVAYLFDGPRSTPQLSFSVRYLGAHAGIVITASHNPPHDNGYKVYFGDGAQIVPPHDKEVVNQVGEVSWSDVRRVLESTRVPPVMLGTGVDEAYLEAASEVVSDSEGLRRSGIRVVYTPIHGTGGVATFPLLERHGVTVLHVEEQDVQDGGFSSVKSPNPENAEALSMGLAAARKHGADTLMGTDPDCDRMGVAVPDESGEWHLLTGNQIGSLLAHHTLSRWEANGWFGEHPRERACLIKTFVTTGLQEEIARGFGVRVLDTLTGFKWIGRKLERYERELREHFLEQGIAIDYDAMPLASRREWLLRHSTAYVFGGEESYGYLASDRVRDKDGSAAVLLWVDFIASVKALGKTVPEVLDELYCHYGYFSEKQINQYYEGADGAARIKNILSSYRADPPKEMAGMAVHRVIDFGRDELLDADGERIPPQDFFIFELEEGFRVAVRGSGTEPKIKFYLFGRGEVSSPAELAGVKESTGARLKKLSGAVDSDARARSQSPA